jgi:pimeloyl-ACP methyl ester carboxylesterase
LGDQVRYEEFSALGLRSRSLEVGPREAEEAAVFLHGHPGSAEDWLGLLPKVGRFARAVALDWPAFGGADRPSTKTWNFSAGTHATFVAAALAELGIKRAHLVMHDLGTVGLMWAAAHPEQFASAVIMGGGILLDFRWHPSAQLYRAPGIGEMMALLANRPSFRAFIRYYNPQPRKLPQHFIDRWYGEYSLETRRAIISFYRATPPMAMKRLLEPLRRLNRPALVLWGAHDRAVPVEQAHCQRESFPSAEVVVFEESGHWPYLDDPKQAAETIVPFLERQLVVEGAAIPSAKEP